MKQRHILLVDDEESIRLTLSHQIKKAGYTVTVAESGEKAMAILRSTNVDIVLTDMSMGDMNGIRILKNVKKLNPEVQVILLTGSGTMEVAIDALRFGAYDFLVKPCSQEELLLKLAKCVERIEIESRLKENQLRITAVMNNVIDGIIAINEQGIIETFNPAAERIFGYNADEVNGRNVSLLMPEPYHSEHDSYLQNHIKTGIKKIIGIGREVVGLRKNGTTFPMDLAVGTVDIGEYRVFTGIVRDITERKQAQEETKKIHAELRVYQKQLEESNIIMEKQVRERTLELHDSRRDVIVRLGKAAEYRDNETGLHVIRMSRSCHLLAQKIGLAEKECELILQASPMHDVGKIGIPDRILLKPGKLDHAEWQIMKTHASIGGEILSGSSSETLMLAEAIARAHHEKFDGSGYPKGLKGEEIPLVGRIVALCDVFDALTSVRPYKKSWSIEETMYLIDKESGKHFDPKLVPIFHECMPEILKIRESFPDLG